MEKVKYTVGADPEIFLSRDGKVIGSERVVPEGKNIVVRDGIQVEFNPPASNSVAILGSWISQAFRNLNQMVERVPGVKIDFTQVVEVDPNEFLSLSPSTRMLGCSPSFNIHGIKPIGLSDEERATYNVRSTGGHLHFGLRDELFDERLRLVDWLDVLVGNTCVLIDREPKAALRRKHYGRAGEYRIPNHGLEYRTPSNFWLHNFTVMDFVFQLAGIAIHIVEDHIDGGDLESQLIDVVNMDRVVKAIDTNDLELAWDNFKDLSKIGVFNRWPMISLVNWLDSFDKKGMTNVFPEDPLESWIRGKQVPFDSKFLYTAKENNG